MKRVVLTLLGCALAYGVGTPTAQALPAFKNAFGKKYNLESKVVTCDVCHVAGKDKKKFKNEFGMVLEPLLDAEQFKGDKKLEGDAADKVIFEALDKAAKEKAKDGKTWEEHIKAGTIPGLKKE